MEGGGKQRLRGKQVNNACHSFSPSCMDAWPRHRRRRRARDMARCRYALRSPEAPDGCAFRFALFVVAYITAPKVIERATLLLKG